MTLGCSSRVSSSIYRYRGPIDVYTGRAHLRRVREIFGRQIMDNRYTRARTTTLVSKGERTGRVKSRAGNAAALVPVFDEWIGFVLRRSRVCELQVIFRDFFFFPFFF